MLATLGFASLPWEQLGQQYEERNQASVDLNKKIDELVAKAKACGFLYNDPIFEELDQIKASLTIHVYIGGVDWETHVTTIQTKLTNIEGTINAKCPK